MIMQPRRILFVCTGNICRSPTAEGVARAMIANAGLSGVIEVDSAGTHGYHVGEAPDPRAIKVAHRRGYDLASLRARKLVSEDFDDFDLLLAMDAGHMRIMKRTCPEGRLHKLAMFMHYAHGNDRDEVPDPFYGSEAGFEAVLAYCEDAVAGLLESLRSDDAMSLGPASKSGRT